MWKTSIYYNNDNYYYGVTAGNIDDIIRYHLKYTGYLILSFVPTGVVITFEEKPNFCAMTFCCVMTEQLYKRLCVKVKEIRVEHGDVPTIFTLRLEMW